MNNFKFIIFRFFNVAGSFYKKSLGETKSPPEHLVPICIRQILKNKKITIFNNFKTKDGSGVRDYIHVEDICMAHFKAMKYLYKKFNNKSQILNLGSKTGVSALHIANNLSKLMVKKIKIIFKNKKKGEPDILISSFKKSKKILNWKPKKNITSILQDSIKWEKKIKKN